MTTEHPSERPRHAAVLVLPRIRVQNANAISSPMTWGFPAVTAFTGLMVALERRLGRTAGIRFRGVGVVCHGHEAQVTAGGYTRAFRLTRNPVLADGGTAAIVEEGRIHLDVSLVFDVQVSDEHRGDAERDALAGRVADMLAGMRLAGGSIMPALPEAARRPRRPWLEILHPKDAVQERRQQFRSLARRCLPGFALVSRDALLTSRLDELKADDPRATVLDAWLDLSRVTTRAEVEPAGEGSDAAPKVEWVRDPRPGWIVPIPVGYTALSGPHAAGTVSGARDRSTPFRFVETVWSVGQWISPHRLDDLDDLTWHSEKPSDGGLYRCRNRFKPTPPTELDLADEAFDD